VLGERAGVREPDERCAHQRGGDQDLVRDHPAVEVGERDRGQYGDEDEAEREMGWLIAEDEDGRHEGGAQRQLDERIAR
jgi:hypothetical protein